MNFEYKKIIDRNFSPQSRVWVYQSSRPFTYNEVAEIEKMLKEFIVQWKSHGTPVKGAGYLFFGQFVLLMADEKATGVSGCSTDSSVRLIKNIEQAFSVDMFERTTLAFVVNDNLLLLPLSQLQQAYDKQTISSDTLYFNNLIQSKEELENTWIIPIKDSWLARKISFHHTIS